MDKIAIIVLAAGKGKRMRSRLPKPLHVVRAKPSIQRVVENATQISKKPIIVIDPRSKKIVETLGPKYTYVIQEKQHGTGDAVRSVKEKFGDYPLAKNIMVIPADHPLVSAKTLRALWNAHKKSNAVLTISTITVPNFEKYASFSHSGRIHRNGKNDIQKIIEEKDASEEEKKIKEVNVSYYCFKTEWLWRNIDAVTTENKSGEFYLTDLVHLAVSQDLPISFYALHDIKEGMGFNTPEELEIIKKLASE